MDNESAKNKIVNFLKRNTNTFEEKKIDEFTTKYISEELHLSRSLTSLYLNELYKEGKLVKVTTRPVYYFYKSSLDFKYKTKFEYEYLSSENFLKELHKGLSNNPFSELAGYSGSLSSVIEQLKTAVLYPRGLPVLLVGEKGTGKRKLAELTSTFYKKRTNTSSENKLEIIKKQNFENLNRLYNTFEGIILIEDIHKLKEDQENKLINFIDNHNERNRIILTTDSIGYENLPTNLIIMLPIIIEVPNWLDLLKSERIKILYDLFRIEEIIFDKKIMLSAQLLDSLVNTSFPNNVDDVIRIVKSISANAYTDNLDNKYINILPFHNFYNKIKSENINFEKDKMFFLEEIFIEPVNKILEVWTSLINGILKSDTDYDYDFYDNLDLDLIDDYSNYLIFETELTYNETKELEEGMQNIVNDFSDSYYVNYPINFSYMMARILLIENQYNSFFQEWEYKHVKQIELVNVYIKTHVSKLNEYTEYLVNQLKINYNINLSFINKLFIYVNLLKFNNNIQKLNTKAVILCHGYSTASSIADTVNKMINLEIFESIDIPIDQPIEKAIQKLNDILHEKNLYENFIFLVDMGSLEVITKEIKTTSTVGIINHVSTPMALEIGMQISKGYKPYKILHEYYENYLINYEVIESKIKEKAIIFTSDLSIEVANDLRKLFIESLPKKINLKLIAYDTVIHNEDIDFENFLEQYEVVLLVRPITMKFKNVPNVSIEDIIDLREDDSLFNIFKSYFNEQEMDDFMDSLLINFSLDSLMNKLLILNPRHLLKQVSDAIMTLQQLLQKKLKNKTIIGLNIHLCFLIEKLVTKSQPTYYPKINNFKKNHKEFIYAVEKSFEKLMNNYNVELPISEIAYIYEYVINDTEGEI